MNRGRPKQPLNLTDEVKAKLESIVSSQSLPYAQAGTSQVLSENYNLDHHNKKEVLSSIYHGLSNPVRVWIPRQTVKYPNDSKILILKTYLSR